RHFGATGVSICRAWNGRWEVSGIGASTKGGGAARRHGHACQRVCATAGRRAAIATGSFRAAVGRHVLAIQDTSEINFRTTSERRRGLGEIGKGVGRGVLVHAMLALDA